MKLRTVGIILFVIGLCLMFQGFATGNTIIQYKLSSTIYYEFQVNDIYTRQQIPSATVKVQTVAGAYYTFTTNSLGYVAYESGVQLGEAVISKTGYTTTTLDIVNMGHNQIYLVPEGGVPPPPIHIMIEIEGSGTTDPPAGSLEIEDSSVTITANPNSGWRYDRMQRNGVDHTQSNPGEFLGLTHQERITVIFVPLSDPDPDPDDPDNPDPDEPADDLGQMVALDIPVGLIFAVAGSALYLKKEKET